MIALFTLTLLLSSALLFLVQPMFGRLVLPLLGGTPAVWNTCMVFFQAMLLAGYLYAHLSTRWLEMRRQVVVHLVLLALPLVVLPLAIPVDWAPPAERNPIPWLLGLLTVALGLPFFVVAATAPLLQRWLSRTDHPDAPDPYFLYGASNAGSMGALLAYPILIEPNLRLGTQSVAWTWGYAVLVLLLASCGVQSIRRAAPGGRAAKAPGAAPVPPPRAPRVGRWIAVAAVPSSLLLGVTTYLTTDLAVVPLLWVVPLALYLLTFALVFARRPLLGHRWMVRAVPATVLLLLGFLALRISEPLGVVMAIHLLAFFILAMACHGELARDRPAAAHLTAFYLWMGLGGVLGGAFNALLAPLLFSSVVEYPLAVMVGAVLLWPVWIARGGGRDPVPVRARAFVWPAAAVLIGLTMILARSAGAGRHENVLEQRRSFFGVHRVVGSVTTAAAGAPLAAAIPGGAAMAANTLYHGTTVHGRQLVDPATGHPARPDLPLTYFHRDGPIGRLFRTLPTQGRVDRIGVVGLGAGVLAAYAAPGQTMTFYEIDPLVHELAEDTRFFTYLSAARQRGAAVDVVLGDARMTLAAEPPGVFDLLVLDAFSSDAIPVHLLTLEAGRMYRERLAPGGVLAFHISNRYVRLYPLLARMAETLGLEAWLALDERTGDEGFWWDGRTGSLWLMMAPPGMDILEPDTPGGIISGRVRAPPGTAPWTDTFANIWAAVEWGW